MASSISSSLGPLFTAGGLASGLDTNSITDQLTQIASQPITDLQARQSATKTQISTLGDLSARLSSLQDAADALGKSGVLGVSVGGTQSAFTATPSSSATAGSFDIGVTQLATAARARSQAFASATSAVTGGTLALSVGGTAYNITVDDGEALSDVAFAINQSGAPVSATILNDGTHAYLSLANRQTGFPIGGAPGDALSVTETSTGSQGQALGLAITAPAQNAQFTIDGLPFTRQSNTFTDAVPGVTISLKSKSANGPETLSLDDDPSATQANLQKFVDAYNHVMQVVQAQFNITGTTDTSQMLTNDPALRGLQGSLANLVMKTVGSGAISSLADLGVETEKDGSLSLDSAKMTAAMTANPEAVNRIFQDATQGIGKAVDSLVQGYTDPVSGILTLDSKSLNDSVSQMDDQIASLQVRVNAYHDNLLLQFTQMEQVVSSMKSVGNYLTAQDKKS